MSRHELVTCDSCGITYRMKHWRVLPSQRMIVIPHLWTLLGSSFWDVCSPKCEDIFRAFSLWLTGYDQYDFNLFERYE